jgi:guanosine-3',5'-bis(diphosphate) 3'-pyrophosphohydrolase
MNDTLKILEACEFAAIKHQFQRRKGYLRIPYINHPIKVSKLIADCNETDINLLLAAILHDVIEDTDTTETELIHKFGSYVTNIVKEVTDDMSLPQKIRKELQVEKAPKLSNPAKLIKIADKICNMNDILNYPLNWNNSKKLYYFQWSNRVFVHCAGINNELDKLFIEIYQKGIQAYS